MDDVASTDEPSRPTMPPASATTEPARPRRAGRRIAIAVVLLLATVAVGFQVQVARVDEQADLAETDQRLAELDALVAGYRLDSVDARLRTAEAAEAKARRTLERSRQDLADRGLQEGLLDDVRLQTAGQVKELRRGVRSVERQIEEQGRLQPAAGACLFDLLRALGQVGGANHSGPRSQACATVAGTRGPG